MGACWTGLETGVVVLAAAAAVVVEELITLFGEWWELVVVDTGEDELEFLCLSFFMYWSTPPSPFLRNVPTDFIL